jgi:error-prone DNA polymerase
MYVNGLRQEIGRAIESAGTRDRQVLLRQAHEGPDHSPRARSAGTPSAAEGRCPKCGCDDPSMIEATQDGGWFCNVCAHEWELQVAMPGRGLRPAGAAPGTATREPSNTRFSSLEELIARTGIRRDELAALAEIGALNALGHHRRSALWQIERAIRPAGALFQPSLMGDERASARPAPNREPANDESANRESPLRPMTPSERLLADYSGTSLTIGPHPLALRRSELALRGVLRAVDLPRGRHGRRVRVAGAVITRQRPGTAKGFVFLTLEDETGIANIIVRPDLFTDQRATIVGAPYLLVEGTLQLQEGVTSVKAERVIPLTGDAPEPQSHDFR